MSSRKASLTNEDRDWLATVEQERRATTPGPWYAHLTDDEHFQSASYVSTEPGEVRDGMVGDQGNHMAPGWPAQADPERVVAVTLLQHPRLAQPEESDANARFIANVHQHIPRLLALIRRLEGALDDDPSVSGETRGGVLQGDPD